MIDTIIFASLALGQAELPASPQYPTQHQKPPAYAQAASPSIDRLLVATQQAQCKTKIEDEEIKKYKKIIADNGSEKEEAISKLLDIYKSLTDKAISGYRLSEKCMNAIIDEAFGFYNDITINHTDSHNKVKAFLDLGNLLGRIISPSNFDEAIEKLREAYDIGDQKIKAEAAWSLAFIYWNYSSGLVGRRGPVQKYDLSDAEKQFRLVIEHDPNSENAKKAREILKKSFPKKKY